MSETTARDFAALRANPGDDALFRSLAARLRREGDHAGLLEAHALRARASDPEYGARLLLSVLALGDGGAAPIESALSLAGRAPGMLARLEEIAHQRGDGTMLANVLLHRAGASAGLAERESVLRRMVRIGVESGQDGLVVEGWLRLAEFGPSLRAEAVAALLPRAEVALAAPETAARFEELVRAERDPRALLQVLDVRLRDAAATTEITALCLELATLAFDVTRDADVALDYLTRAHRRSPSEGPRLLQAVRTLRGRIQKPGAELIQFERQLSEQAGDWTAVATLLQQEAALATAPAAAAELLVRAGDTHAARRSDVDAALPLYAEAARLAPAMRSVIDDRLAELRRVRGATHGAALRELQLSMLERAGDWAGIADLLRADAGEQAPRERAQTLLRLAEIELNRLGRSELALRSLVSAARTDGGAEATADAVERLFGLLPDPRVRADVVAELSTLLEERRAWDDLVRLRRRQLETTAAIEDRAHIHFLLAGTLAEHAGQPASAADELERACELMPGNARFYDGARRLRLELGQPDDALRLLNREYRETRDGERRIELDCERARIFAEVKGDLRLAIDAAFAALEEQDDEPRLRASFQALLADGRNAAVVESLAASFLERGDRTHAQSLLWLAGRELGLASDIGCAFALRATEVAAVDPVRLLTLRGAVDERDIPEERIRVYRLLAEVAPTQLTRTEARFTLAGLYLSVRKTAEAIALLEDLIDESPETESYHLKLVEALQTRGEPVSMVAAAERALTAAPLDADGALGLLRLIGRTAAGPLANPEKAAHAWQRVLEIEPADTEATVALRGYASTSGDVRAWFDALSATIPELDDTALREQRHLELAVLASEQLGDPSMALAHWAAVARAQTLSAAEVLRARRALTDDAIGRGEHDEVQHFLLDELEVMADDEGAAMRAEEVVERMFASRAMAPTMAALDVAFVALRAPSPWLLDQRAQLALRIGRDDAALESFARWQELSPETLTADRLQQYAAAALRCSGDDAAWELAIAAARASIPGPEMVEAVVSAGDAQRQLAYGRTLLTIADGVEAESAFGYRYLAADLLQGSGAPIHEVTQIWSAIVSDDPQQLPALEKLRDQAAADGEIEAFRAFLEDRLSGLEDPEAGIGILQVLVATAPDDAARADALRRVAEVDLGDVQAREALATWYRRTEAWPALADVLTDLAEIEEDVVRRKQHYLALSRVAAFQLEDRDRAIAALETLLELDPTEASALERLEKLYRQAESWPALGHTLERLAALAPNDDRRVELLRALAELRERRLDDRAGAIDAWHRVLAVEPANLPVMEELARLYADADDWTQHLTMLERLATATSMRDLQAEVYVRAARVMHEKIERSMDAFGLVTQALDLLPATDELLGLARETASAAGAWVELAGLLRKVAEAERDDARRVALEAEIGRLLDEKADQGETALQWLLDCFDRRPAPGAVLDALEQIAERRGARTALVDVYKRLAGEGGDVDIAWRALVGSAEVAEREVRRPDVAFDIFLNAAERPGMRQRAEEQMLRIAASAGLWEKWCTYLEGRDDQLSGGALIDNVLRRAEVEETQIANWERAFETLVAYFPEFPDNVRLREALSDRARRHDAWPLVLRLFEYMHGQASNDDQRIAWLREMSRVCSDEMNNAEGAFTQWLRAWQLRPRDAELRDGLVTRAEAAGRELDLLAAWEWLVRHVSGADDREDALQRATDLSFALRLPERFITAVRQHAEMHGRTLAVLDAAWPRVVELDARSAWFEMLVDLLGDVRDRDARAEIRLRVATLGEELDRRDEAISVLREGLADQRRVPELRARYIELVRAVGDDEALTDAIDAHLPSVDDGEARFAFGSELVGALLRLGQGDRATAAALRMLARDPASGSVQAFVENHLAAVERWDDLIEYHIDQAGRTDDAATRRRHFLAAAGVAGTTLGDARRALRVIEPLLHADPADIDALSVKAGALSALGRWPEYLDALGAMAGATTGRVAARAWSDAAQAAETQMFDTGRADELWAKAAEADTSWYVPLRERARIASESNRRGDALRLARAAAELADGNGVGGRELSDVRVFLAQLLLRGTEAGEKSEAAVVAERAVEADPTHAAARGAFEQALRATGGAERLIALVDEELLSAPDDATRTWLLMRRAQLCALDARRDADARKAAERAVQLAPTSAGPNLVLGDVHFYAARYDEAARAYRAAFDGETLRDTDSLPETRLLVPGEFREADPNLLYGTRLGIALARSGKLDPATELLEGVTLEDDRYVPAALELARLLRDRGALAASRVYVQAVLAQRDILPGDIVTEMQSLAARIAESEGDHAAAARLYADASSTAPGGVAAARRAVQLSLQTGATESVTANLERLIELSSNPEERAAALATLGGMELEDASTFERGVQRLTEAVVTAGEHSRATETAAAALAAIEPPSRAITALELALDRAEGAHRRMLLLLARAGAHQRADGPASRDAAEDCSEALAGEPGSPDALERAVAAWTAVGDPAGLASALQDALGHIDPGAVGQRIELLRHFARLQREHLHQLDDARDALEELRMLAPDDVRVMQELLTVYDEQEREEDDEAATALALALVDRGALSESLLRTLERLHYASNNVDAVLQVLQVLRIAGQASAEEIDLLESLPSTLPAFGADSLTDDTYANFLAWDAPVADLMSVMADVGRRLASTDAGAAPASAPVAETSALMQEFAVLRDAFALPEALLRVSTEGLITARLSLGDPLVLTMPEQLRDETNRHVIRFEVGRALAMARPELRATASLSTIDFLALFEAAIDPLVSSRPALDASLARRVDVWRQRLGDRATPAGTPRVDREALPSAAAYRDFAERVGVRAGVLTSFDSRAGLRILAEQADEVLPVGLGELRDLCERNAGARALVTYVLSDRYLKARRSLGLVLGHGA